MLFLLHFSFTFFALHFALSVDPKSFADSSLFTLHCTTMCQSFQMKKAVDKQEFSEIFKVSAVERGLFSYALEIKKNFAFYCRKSEA